MPTNGCTAHTRQQLRPVAFPPKKASSNLLGSSSLVSPGAEMQQHREKLDQQKLSQVELQTAETLPLPLTFGNIYMMPVHVG